VAPSALTKEEFMSARKQIVATVLLACLAPGCNVTIDHPAANPRAENPRVQKPPTTTHPVVLAGVRWEAALTDAIERSASSDPRKPIVLLRLLGTLDDKL
jgi:hypothetical protein